MRLAAAIAIGILAVAVRVSDLSSMPMHADEAVQAARLADLLGGVYRYDPNDYHGPVLLYAAAPAAWISGAIDFANLTEPMLRSVPALAGGALAFASACFWLPAGLLVAVSPAMVFYGRYFIPETMFVLVSFGVVVCALCYGREKNAAWAGITGAMAGLLFATKETAVIVLAASLAAAAWRPVPVRHWLAAVLGGAATLGILLGVPGAFALVQSYVTVWAPRATDSVHVQPWWFYLSLLGRTEGMIVVLALVAMPFAWAAGGVARFLVVQTAVLAFLYSAIPYKTPWCALGVLHGLTMIAGFGLSQLKARWSLTIAGLALLAMSRMNAPAVWAYAATAPDVFRVAERFRTIDPSTRIQVVSKQNLWPLPWYLRRHPNVGWRKDAPQDELAPVILTTPEMEDALVHAMYEVPPPGQRRLYVPLFESPVMLRPGVEVRGYVRY